MTMKIKIIKNIYNMIQNKGFEYINKHIKYITYDLCKYKLFHNKDDKQINNSKKSKISNVLLKINYENRIIEDLDINRIINLKHIKATIPQSFNEKKPIIIFKYNNSIRNKIFNYVETLQNIDSYRTITCDCQNNQTYCNKNLNHVLTGNLDIISNRTIKKLLTYGPNYRTPTKPNFKKIRMNIQNSIDECIKTWMRDENVDKVVLQEWKNEVLKEIEKAIKGKKKRRKKADRSRTRRYFRR